MEPNMPSPRKVFPLRLAPVIRERLEQSAEDEGLSVNQLVSRILAQAMGLPVSVTRARTSAAHEVELEAKVAQRRPAAAARPVKKQRQGDECACGSGKKFKHCHGRKP
jgi:hypothetical protein